MPDNYGKKSGCEILSSYDGIAHVRIQRGIGGPDTPLKNNKYVYGFL